MRILRIQGGVGESSCDGLGLWLFVLLWGCGLVWVLVLRLGECGARGEGCLILLCEGGSG